MLAAVSATSLFNYQEASRNITPAKKNNPLNSGLRTGSVVKSSLGKLSLCSKLRLKMKLTVSGLLLLSSSDSKKQSLMMPFLELHST